MREEREMKFKALNMPLQPSPSAAVRNLHLVEKLAASRSLVKARGREKVFHIQNCTVSKCS